MGKCGCFFFRATTFISRGKSAHFTRSWSSGKMLAFQPRGFVFEPVGMRLFFNKYSEAEGSHFFRYYEIFRLCETFFFRNFLNVPKESFHFFDILQQNECLKSQRVPFFRIFGTMRLFKILICFFFESFLKTPFSFFFHEFLMSTKGPPFSLFDILQHNEC